MSQSKENLHSLTERDYIRYLYQEGLRKGVHKKPNFYSELIVFVNSPKGQEGLNKFIHLNPQRVGITTNSGAGLLKKAFQL